MDDAKQQIIARLQTANNILVTVSANPTVDQLSACIGLTLLLNKLNKHATAVFSGKVPSTIEFLKPEETLEDNTDSLRDFIIALDKSKADKLRYKVEDEVVKIFITPYKSSITEKDLIFSQGDFNVDVVMALGVREAQDLDNAITAHGRILHDAVVISVNTTGSGELGSINWLDHGASGVSELVTSLATALGADLLDSQIATALLTGIVAETKRFSNEKTTPATMTASAALLAAGANQQLVSKELGPDGAPKPTAAPDAASTPAPAASAAEPQQKQGQDGELDVPHDDDDAQEKQSSKKAPKQPAKTDGGNVEAALVPAAETADQPKPDTAATENGDSRSVEDKTSVEVEKPEPEDKPAGEPAPRAEKPETDPDTNPAGKSAGQRPAESTQPHMKRIEPLPHEGEAPKPPKVEKSLEELLQEADAELNSPGPELPTPSAGPIAPVAAAEPVQLAAAEPAAGPTEPSAPIIELPPDPDEQKANASPVPPAAPDTPEFQPGPGPGAATAGMSSVAPVAPLTDAPQATDAAANPAPAPAQAADQKETLSDIENSVHSPHVDLAEAAKAEVDNARKAVEDALKGVPDPVTPPIAAGAINIDLDLGHDTPAPGPVSAPVTPQGASPAADLPDYLQTPGTAPVSSVPPTINVPPPQTTPATSTNLPPQGPPPPPIPPPISGA